MILAHRMQLLVASSVALLLNIFPIVHLVVVVVHLLLFSQRPNIKTQGNHNDFTNVVVDVLLTPVTCALLC